MSALGVEISNQKTHRSKYFMEFAKRYFVPKGEISPFSIKALYQESKSFMAFYQLVRNQKLRGWFPVIAVRDALFMFYTFGKSSWRRKSQPRLYQMIQNTETLYK